MLDEPKVLAELCGPQDSNLLLIEDLLDVGVRSRGNEIFVESDDNEKRNIAVKLLQELKEYALIGQSPDGSLVRAIHTSLTSDDADEQERLRETYITIPSHGKSVYPRSWPQALYMQGMQKRDMVFCVGPAGTGKTFLAVAHALALVLSKQLRKLVLTRPVVEAGENLGFLPGDLGQKLNPYLRPLYDHMESLVGFDTVRRLEDTGVLEIAPLAYMRGRSLSNCYVILDEAQNTSPSQMKMFLTRMGEGTKMVITGDVTQIDLPKTRSSGLIDAVSVLKHIPEIHFSYFTSREVVRSPLVRRIVSAYEEQHRSD